MLMLNNSYRAFLVLVLCCGMPIARADEIVKTKDNAKEYYAIEPLSFADQGCAEDFLKASELNGLVRRKTLHDLLEYGCMEQKNVWYHVAVLETRTVDLGMGRMAGISFGAATWSEDLVKRAFNLEVVDPVMKIATGFKMSELFRPAWFVTAQLIPLAEIDQALPKVNDLRIKVIADRTDLQLKAIDEDRRRLVPKR